MDFSKNFPGKVLLFGEHCIIHDAKGLAVPFPHFSGHWDQSKSTDDPHFLASSSALKSYLSYLKSHSLPSGRNLNLNALEADLANGIYFNSDIPTGYGVGSSGSVVAAIYSDYQSTSIKEDEISIQLLKEDLALMESYFHGKSSGLDPLIIYLNKGILLEPGRKISAVDVPCLQKENKGLFLLDTKINRETGTYVNIYLQKAEESTYRQQLAEKLLPYNEECINALLNGEPANMENAFKTVSAAQLEYFAEMIPKPFEKLFEHGLSTGNFALKICGAGGGGYFLGYTNNLPEISRLIKDYSIIPLN